MSSMAWMRTPFVFLAGAALLLACGGRSEDEAPPPQPGPEASAQQLPPGHPPLDRGPAAGTIQPPPAGTGTGESALAWTAPVGWLEEPPGSPVRRAQYRVGTQGQGQCVVYYFGPGQGGEAEANARMWADQFTQADGRSSREVMATEQIEVNGIPVLLVEVTGTYNARTGTGSGQESTPGYMLLGAVAEGSDANWFIKFTGPRDVVVAQREAFEQMIGSLRRGG